MDSRAVDPIPAPKETPSMGLVRAAETSLALMVVESSRPRAEGCTHKGSTSTGSFGLLVAKSPGERAGRGAGEASEHQGFNWYRESCFPWWESHLLHFLK